MRVVVLTISDGVAAGTRTDHSGEAAAELLSAAGYEAERALVSDELEEIVAVLRAAVEGNAPLIVTTGGTGFGPRDVAPEATRVVVERDAPGLAEMLRAEGLKHTPMASLSRGIAGIAGETLIVNLPGSTKAVRENLDALIPVLGHALKLLSGDTKH